MTIFLNPNSKHPHSLREVYKRAFERAEEICLATAYLTDWDATHSGLHPVPKTPSATLLPTVPPAGRDEK